MKYAILGSGSGTILEHMLQNGLWPDVVMADNAAPSCHVLEIAERHALESDRPMVTMMMPKQGKYFRQEHRFDAERVTYTKQVLNYLKGRGIELVVMAGWMTVFSPEMFELKVINIHPSLFEAGKAVFPGGRAVRDALAAFGREEISFTGSSVHIATAALDQGPSLAQVIVKIYPYDTEDSLHRRIKRQERPLYTEVVRDILSGKIDLEEIMKASLMS